MSSVKERPETASDAKRLGKFATLTGSLTMLAAAAWMQAGTRETSSQSSPTTTILPTNTEFQVSPSATPEPELICNPEIAEPMLDNLNCQPQPAIYDLDIDGRISAQDIQLVRDKKADFTGNGISDQADLKVVEKHLGKQFTPQPATPRSLEDTFMPDEILVQFAKDISAYQKAKIYEENQLQRLADLGRPDQEQVAFRGQNIEVLIEKLEKYPEIELVSENTLAKLNYLPNITPYKPNDPSFPNQWNLQMIRAPLAWNYQTKGSAEVKIAVIDTGVYQQHPDLVAKLEPGYNAVDNNSDTADIAGHGTMVAGIAAAQTDNDEGIAGVGFNTKIIPLRACIQYLDSSYACPEAYTTAAINWLANNVIYTNRKVVINISYGSQNPRPFEKAAIDFAIDYGAIVVAGSGNGGNNQIDYPARYGNVIAVGAVLQNGSHDPNSNYGPELDVAAPTKVLTTTMPIGPNYYDRYGLLDGTSAAAPHVSGEVALWLTVGPLPSSNGYGLINGVVEQNAKQFLEVALPEVSYGDDSHTRRQKDNLLGWGVADVYKISHWAGCRSVDLNSDKLINVVDDQRMAFRYGASFGLPLYHPRYDLDPLFGDWDIDIKDLQFVFGRNSWRCY